MKKNLLAKNLLKLASLASFFAISGCAEYHKRVLEDTPESGNEFTRALAKEYETLGHMEQTIMYDEYSADYYYLKAIRSKEGWCVGPTNFVHWDIDPKKLPELEQARERLLWALSQGAREIAPKPTAHAQAHFDCWVEQQDEGWQENDIQWCKDEFEKSIKQVEQKLAGGS